MNIKSIATRVWNKFEDLIFKNHACLVCRKEIVDGTKFSICKKCFENMHIISGHVCQKCGEQLLEGNMLCDKCKDFNFDFDKSNSFVEYDEGASKIVKRLKYGGKKYYAKHIADMMLENDEYFKGVDLICFVPIGKKRRRERGFNQAEEIAKCLSQSKNIPLVELLEKVGSEKHQAGLSQKERQKNLNGTIRVKEQELETAKGKTVLIVDDVFTTGATLSECAKTLKANKKLKPKRICCYTFAKTKLNSTNNG